MRCLHKIILVLKFNGFFKHSQKQSRGNILISFPTFNLIKVFNNRVYTVFRRQIGSSIGVNQGKILDSIEEVSLATDE